MCKVLFDKITAEFNRLSEKLGKSIHEEAVDEDNSSYKIERGAVAGEHQQQTESVLFFIALQNLMKILI